MARSDLLGTLSKTAVGREELEEGKEKERKVWEREKYKNLWDRGVGAGDSPRQGLRLDQMQRTMGLEAAEPEGKEEGAHEVRSERALCFKSQGHGHPHD